MALRHHNLGVVAESISMDELRDALRMLPDGDDPRGRLFIAGSQSHPRDRTFGGLLLAQAVMAAGADVPPSMLPVALQAEFLAGVHADAGPTWLVEDLGTSPSLISRRATVVTDAGPAFTATVRFGGVRDDLPSYTHVRRRDVPGPDGLAELYERFDGDDRIPPWWRLARPVDFRPVEHPVYVEAAAEPADEQSVWWRAHDLSSQDDLLRCALVAYVSDMSVIEPVFRATGSARHRGSSRILSLTHSLVLHRRPCLDGWVQTDSRVADLAHGRALGHVEMHNAEGHLASATQLALVKLD